MSIVDELNTIIGLPRIVIVIALALAAHLLAEGLRRSFLLLGRAVSDVKVAKLQTVVQLVSGVTVFSVYFLAFGLVLAEMGVSITAYLATASVIGLAVGFGSQNIVQDVITGLTVILSDLIEIGDMVEISGQVGIVRSIGMRFTVLENSMGARVYIPNRTLASMINYPRGYIRCLVDIELTGNDKYDREIEAAVEQIVQSAREQFPGILRAPVELEGRRETASGKIYLRVKFRIWPGRGSIIETTFRQDLLARIKQIDADYADYRVAVNYEIDRK